MEQAAEKAEEQEKAPFNSIVDHLFIMLLNNIGRELMLSIL